MRGGQGKGQREGEGVREGELWRLSTGLLLEQRVLGAVPRAGGLGRLGRRGPRPDRADCQDGDMSGAAGPRETRRAHRAGTGRATFSHRPKQVTGPGGVLTADSEEPKLRAEF